MLTILRPRGSQNAELTDLPCPHSPRRQAWPSFDPRKSSTAWVSTLVGSTDSITASLRVSQTLPCYWVIIILNPGCYKTYLINRVFDAAKMKWFRTGFMLTDPILFSDKRYRLALDLSWRRSRCVMPPSESDNHISFPVGVKSMQFMRVSSNEYTSREIPEVNEKLRTVQSYALV